MDQNSSFKAHGKAIVRFLAILTIFELLGGLQNLAEIPKINDFWNYVHDQRQQSQHEILTCFFWWQVGIMSKSRKSHDTTWRGAWRGATWTLSRAIFQFSSKNDLQLALRHDMIDIVSLAPLHPTLHGSWHIFHIKHTILFQYSQKEINITFFHF